MRSLSEGLPALVEEFHRRPYGPHTPELQALLTKLRTRPRARKLVLGREGEGRLRLCELHRDPIRLVPLSFEPFGSLDEAERAVFDLRLGEFRTDGSSDRG